MRLTRLSLSAFRNFARLMAELPSGALIVVGPNAQGKTSLLEAVYFLATLTSQQAGSDRELIHFATAQQPLAVARVVGEFLRQGRKHTLEVRIIRERNGLNGGRTRKEVLLNGVKVRLLEAVGRFNAVLFLPQMLEIVTGAPEKRRRYLNLALAQAQPGYAARLAEYNKVLAQRNALLKQLGAERRHGLEALEVWDAQLSRLGAQVIHARIRALTDLDRLVLRLHRALTGGKEALRLVYRPSFDPWPQPPGQLALPVEVPVDRTSLTVAEIAEGFAAALRQARGEDLARGVTTLGPHRDEWRLLANGLDLGVFGSRGQVRTAMLSLKLAEAQWLQHRTGEAPVVLLDEVLAELDGQRREDLLAFLEPLEQVLLTTTDLRLFASAFVRRATRWYLSEGILARVEPPGEETAASGEEAGAPEEG